jgi:hypothetical protein
VPGKRYRVDASYFGSSLDNPENVCFELGPAPLPSGVYNASACRFCAPFFMSQPHFYQVRLPGRVRDCQVSRFMYQK